MISFQPAANSRLLHLLLVAAKLAVVEQIGRLICLRRHLKQTHTTTQKLLKTYTRRDDLLSIFRANVCERVSKILLLLLLVVRREVLFCPRRGRARARVRAVFRNEAFFQFRESKSLTSNYNSTITPNPKYFLWCLTEHTVAQALRPLHLLRFHLIARDYSG